MELIKIVFFKLNGHGHTALYLLGLFQFQVQVHPLGLVKILWLNIHIPLPPHIGVEVGGQLSQLTVKSFTSYLP